MSTCTISPVSTEERSASDPSQPQAGSGAQLWHERHNHLYDPQQPCLEITKANNSGKRGVCLVHEALALATEKSRLQGTLVEAHGPSCHCGACILDRRNTTPVPTPHCPACGGAS